MKLVLFFNGWGLDEQVVSHLSLPKNLQLKVVNFPYELNPREYSNFSEIIPIGYSFGVYYLSEFLKNNLIHFKKSIAINGTPEVIGKYGISPKVFQLTLENLTEKTLQLFFQNMDVPSTFQKPQKSIIELKAELNSLKTKIQWQPNCFTHAIISEQDRIIPTKRQVAYFQKKTTPTIFVKGGHFPFPMFNSWEEIFVLCKSLNSTHTRFSEK